jgi:hypothetical protein
MRGSTRLALLGILGLAAVTASPPAARAATPAVYTVVEGKDTSTGKPVLVLLGNGLTGCKSFELTDSLGNPAGDVVLVLKSRNMAVLSLPEGLPQGTYGLTLGYGRGLEQSHQVVLTNGMPLEGTVQETALATTLKDDLDDAATLGGHAPAWYCDATNVDAGVLDPARFSAWDDLVAESKVGTAAGQVAAGDHLHDGRYFTETESDARYPSATGLSTAGTINNAGNPVDWTRLKNVPAGIADGVDSGATYTAAAGGGLSLSGTAFSASFGGTGSATTVARSDHDHDTRYYTQSQLNATGGTLNSALNPVDWSRLKNIPTGIADGVDDNSWTESGANAYRATGRIGIGTTSPNAALQCEGLEGVVFGGQLNAGTFPTSSSSVRMVWYPKKAAFRAGLITSTQWDDANIGTASFATGEDSKASEYAAFSAGWQTIASGQASVAMGYATEATGGNAVALGASTLASGGASTAMGSSTTASNSAATSMGSGTTASGFAATAMGWNGTASGQASTAMGVGCTASGNYSIATGSATFATGAFSISGGFQTTAQAQASLVLGRYNVIAGTTNAWVATDPVLVVGNGTSTLATANCFTLLKNGNLTIAGTLTQSSDGRLKKDVAPVTGALRKVTALRGVSYLFKDGSLRPSERQIGLVAQEVREVLPELVQEGADGNLAVAYGNLSAVLVEAVKEQQAEIDEKDREIAALRKELAAAKASIEERLARLEKAAAPASK